MVISMSAPLRSVLINWLMPPPVGGPLAARVQKNRRQHSLVGPRDASARLGRLPSHALALALVARIG
jgi:hypothetical protein